MREEWAPARTVSRESGRRTGAGPEIRGLQEHRKQGDSKSWPLQPGVPGLRSPPQAHSHPSGNPTWCRTRPAGGPGTPAAHRRWERSSPRAQQVPDVLTSRVQEARPPGLSEDNLELHSRGSSRPQASPSFSSRRAGRLPQGQQGGSGNAASSGHTAGLPGRIQTQRHVPERQPGTPFSFGSS